METDEDPKLADQGLPALNVDEFEQQLRMMVNRTRWAAQAGFDFRAAAYGLPRPVFDSVRDCQDPEERLLTANPDHPMWTKLVTDHVMIYTSEPPRQKPSVSGSGAAGARDHGPEEGEAGGNEGEDEGDDYHIFLIRGETLQLPVYKQYKFDLDRSCPACPAKMRRYGEPQDVPETSDIKMIWECEKCETRVIQMLRLEHTSWEPGPRGRVLKAPL